MRALQLETSGRDRNGERVLLGKMAANQVMVSDAQNDGNMLMPNRCWRDGRKSVVRNETDATGMMKTLADRASRNRKRQAKPHHLGSNSGSEKITGIPY